MRLSCTGPRPALDLDALAVAPTPDQRQALAFDREIAVTAGAGAGKTQTLSLRYALLLLDLAIDAVHADPRRPRPSVEQVLVLTFTEKAAEEMADRCYRRLLGMARAVRDQRDDLDAAYGASFGAALAASVEHLLDTFDRAAISTFHGFCARLLREHPAETETPPGFEVLEEADALRIREASIEAALQALYAERPEALGPLYDAFGSRGGIVRALRTLLAEAWRVRARLTDYARGAVRLTEWAADVAPGPEAVREWLHTRAAPLLEEVERVLAPGPSAWLEHTLRPLLARLADLGDDPLTHARLYEDVLDAFLTGSGASTKVRSLTHATVIGAKGKWPSAAAYADAKRYLAEVAESVADFAERSADARLLLRSSDRVLLDTLEILARLALDALARQREALDAARAVDFAALQERAVAAVLGDTGLRETLQARHRYLMVDEFQDTDEAQWALVRALGRSGDRPSDRIFFVGDVKQAIYGFRGSDVTVFGTATDALAVEPVVLRDNFRSRDVLIEWFNAVFETLLGPPDPGRPRFEAPYEPLRARRRAPGGSVCIVAHDEGDDAPASASAEADAIARFVAGTVLPGRAPYDGAWTDRAEHPTPPVAILLRRRTHQGLFERALRAHGVPFVVARGVGFWSRPEVLDLVNAAHALAADDPISITGWLRSPLGCVPDDALIAFTEGRSLRLRTFGRGRAPAGCDPHLARAWQRYAALRAARDRVPVSALLRRVLSEGVAWHAWSLDGDAEVAEANAARLIDLAARFDSRGADGLEAFADWCLARVEAAEREDEAAVLPTEARVVLLTVHASKGLEFPIVIVPQCGVAGAPPGPAVTVRRAPSGWDLAFRVVEAGPPPASGARGVRTRAVPGRLALLQRVQRDEEAAEDRRLLYVAATRAKDHLVLVGKVGPRGAAAGSWMARLAEHHGDPLVDADGARVMTLGALAAWDPTPAPAPAPPPPPPEDAAEAIRAVAEPPRVEVSPSSLDRFEACPARWMLGAVLRVPEGAVRGGAGASWSVRLAGVRGDIIHGALEDDIAHDPAAVASRWRAAAFAEGCPAPEVEALLPDVAAHLERATRDPALQAVLSAEGLDEVGFRITEGEVTLRGQIDRLYLDPVAREWVVLDYKSEALSADGVEIAAAAHERQLLAYAWAASRILVGHGQPPVRSGALYFTALGAFHRYPRWDAAAFTRVEALLRAVGEVASASFVEVERRAIDPAIPRPCGACGYRGRTCRGQ